MRISGLYDAGGVLLQRKEIALGTPTITRDYVGGVEYVDVDIESIGHAEGRVYFTSSTSYRYEYNILDHLGNTRIVYSDLNNNGSIDSNSEVLWEEHYYSFGMQTEGFWLDAPDQETNYKYNGIEHIDAFAGPGLDFALYRTLDPSIGRWLQVDTKAEMAGYGLSPYNSMANNPISFNDPNGNIIPALLVGAEIGAGTSGTLEFLADRYSLSQIGYYYHHGRQTN